MIVQTNQFKSLLLVVTFLIVHCASVNAINRNFVNPQLGDRVIDLAVEAGHTLDDIRYSLGNVIMASQTITDPGYFMLGDNIEGSLIIDTDDIWLDLNNFQITGTTKLINIQPGNKNITITNGFLKGADISSASGVYISPGNCSVKIENIFIEGCQKGIHVDGNLTATTENGLLTKCTFSKCNKAVVLNYVNNFIFRYCEALKCNEVGFELTNSKLNKFEICEVLTILNNDPDTPIFGFSSTLGSGNLFLSCVVEGVQKELSNSSINATGFLFEEETKSYIANNLINKIEVSGSGKAYGINLIATCTQNSVIQNDISNITGETDGIGIEGDDTQNVIMQNISYENDTAYVGLTPANIYTGGTSGSPGNLINVQIPPY